MVELKMVVINIFLMLKWCMFELGMGFQIHHHLFSVMQQLSQYLVCVEIKPSGLHLILPWCLHPYQQNGVYHFVEQFKNQDSLLQFSLKHLHLVFVQDIWSRRVYISHNLPGLHQHNRYLMYVTFTYYKIFIDYVVHNIKF